MVQYLLSLILGPRPSANHQDSRLAHVRIQSFANLGYRPNHGQIGSSDVGRVHEDAKGAEEAALLVSRLEAVRELTMRPYGWCSWLRKGLRGA